MWDLAFSSDSSQLFAAAHADGVIAWQIPSGEEVRRLSKPRGGISHVALSPDDQTLATIALDDTLRLWHAATGHELFTLLQHTGKLEWLQFVSPTRILVGARQEAGRPLGVFVFDAPAPDRP